MGKQGTLHPRKHPCSSAGVVPEHTHKQTDSDTHRQIQTHTETHTPNGCFPSLKAPTFCPSTPLPPEPSLKQKQHHLTPHSLWKKWILVATTWSQVTPPSLKGGIMKSPRSFT